MTFVFLRAFSLKKFVNQFKIKQIFVAVIITALVVGGIFGFQYIEYKEEVDELRQTIEKLNGQALSERDNKAVESNTNLLWDTVEVWNKISTGKLEGFSPKTSLVEKSTEPENRNSKEHCKEPATVLESGGNYLKVEGALCGVGYWLEDTEGIKIDSFEKLISRFGPVETEAEAVSFVSTTKEDLEINKNGVTEGHTLTIKDGFLVQVVYQNTFGCGSHESSRVIFKITRRGEIQKIAFEEPKPGSGPTICAD